jgi:Domain of unknown function (DUF4340)
LRARPAILYTIIFFILLPIYFWSIPTIKPSAALEQQKQESLLKLSSGIDAITISSGPESLRFQKTGEGRYQVVAPPGKFIPQDLMNAMIALLLNAKSVEVVAENSNDLAQFGLDHPKSEVIIEAPGKPQPIKLAFGNENPTHTAIYAQIEGTPKVFLLGENLEYYQSLMFQWIEGKQGKNA